MARYAVKHKPSGKFFYEDEGGAFLLDEKDGVFSYGRKSDAEEVLKYLKEYMVDGSIFTEDGDFPFDEFEVGELK